MRKERILYLDLVRIVSFLLVTLYHFTVTAETYEINADFGMYQLIAHIMAPLALSAFFMVSGAALIYQYAGGLSCKEFYKKRFLGIFPLFWLAYLIVFLDFFYQAGSMPEAPKINFLLTVIGMDGYLNDYLPTFYLIGEWFLGILIILYLIFPLYRIIMLKNKYILPVVFLVLSIGLLYYNPFPMFIEKNLIMCSFYFVIGMMIEMVRTGTDQRKFAAGRRIAAVVGAVIFIVLLILELKGIVPNKYIKIFIRTISCYMIIMEAAEWFHKESLKKIIGIAGRHSYAFFLLHHVVLNRYISHFAGNDMSGSNVLFLLLSSVFYIYLLAVALDKLYEFLRRKCFHCK